MQLRLVNPSLAAVRRPDRLRAKRIGALAAVPASLAHPLVDDGSVAAGSRGPRFRLRRSSVAHSWSWISTVTPGSGRARPGPRRASPGLARTPRGSAPLLESRALLGGDHDLATPSASAAGRQKRPRAGRPDCLPAGHRDRRVVEELVGHVLLAAMAARSARLPEWRNVPSPMFWTKWGVLDVPAYSDPLRALAAHWPRPMIHPCAGPDASTAMWQPIPAPTMRAGAAWSRCCAGSRTEVRRPGRHRDRQRAARQAAASRPVSPRPAAC